MLITRTSEPHLVSRPLHMRAFEFDGAIWFFASMSGDKVAELTANLGVNIAYANEREGVYDSIERMRWIVTVQGKIDP